MVSVLAALLTIRPGGDVYTKFVKDLKAADTLSGRVTSTWFTPDGKKVYRYVFAFRRPNFWRFEMWDEKHCTQLGVSDGKDRWVLDPIQNRLGKQAAGPVGTGLSFDVLEPYDDPRGSVKERWCLASPQGRPARFHGRQATEFVLNYIEPGETIPRPNASVRHLFMDPRSGLPMGTTNSEKAAVKVETVFDELKIGPKIDPSTFKLKSPVSVNDSLPMESFLLPLGSVAPHFKGKTLDGKSFSLTGTLKGAKALVLDFWTTGCPACLEGMPVLEELEHRYSAKGLKVVSVYMADRTGLSQVVRERHVTLPIVIGPTCKSDLAFDYKATIFPVTYLIDPKGIVIGRYDDPKKLSEDLKRMDF